MKEAATGRWNGPWRGAMALACLALASCAGAPSGGQKGDGTLRGEPLELEGSLTVEKVKGTFVEGDVLVVDVHVHVDGSLIKSCHLEDLDRDVCVEHYPLAPGPHQLSIFISCRNARTLGFNHPSGGACEFSLEDSINVAPRQAIALDLSRASRQPDKFQAALTPSPLPLAATDCQRSLYALLSGSTCQPAGLDRAAALAQEAVNECEDELEDRVTRRLVTEVFSQTTRLSPLRCLSGGERADIPQVLISGFDGWPEETLPAGTSSWSWSREVASPKLERAGAEEQLSQLEATIRVVRERSEVFWQLVGAFHPRNDAAGRSLVLRAAEGAPFDLDPRSVAGHRNFLLIGTETQDAAYQDFVARGVQVSERLHCDRYPLARDLSLFFTRGPMSADEWKAVQSMMTRTPKTSRVHECDYVFRDDLGGGVSLSDRMRWLFQFDCDPERRHPALLGERTQVHLRPDSTLPAALREEMLAEFAGCLERRKASVSTP